MDNFNWPAADQHYLETGMAIILLLNPNLDSVPQISVKNSEILPHLEILVLLHTYTCNE
jgi:hypothetical protein